VATATRHRGDDRGDSHPCRGPYFTSTRDVTRRDNGPATEAKIMRAVWLVVLSVLAFQAQAAILETITQTTTGSCSPAVGQAGGNVTITCQGLDDQALARLNEFLDKKFAALLDESLEKKTATRLHQLLDIKDLELQAKIREAEE
jgi:hypothetical protein